MKYEEGLRVLCEETLSFYWEETELRMIFCEYDDITKNPLHNKGRAKGFRSIMYVCSIYLQYEYSKITYSTKD